MNRSWVIGSHGLLGRALCSALQADSAIYRPNFRFDWSNAAALHHQFRIAVAQFGDLVRGADNWSIYWAAGVGTMQSGTATLAPEIAAFRELIHCLETDDVFRRCPGGLAVASSAGAIYAGSRDAVISDFSAPAPTTAYASAKLEQEAVMAAYAVRNPTARLLAARCSTLYGPGQALGKQQGLLTHMSRSIWRNAPIQIFVPLDTIRDYLCTDDAARVMVGTLHAIPPGALVTKVVASECPVTISEILGIFRRISRRSPRIITSTGQTTALYSRRIQFKSAVDPSGLPAQRVSLVVGIARLLEAERLHFAAGSP